MSRYIRYKYQKQQINFLNCNDLNKWIDTCQTRIVGFDSICSTSSCNCKEYGTNEYEPLEQYKKLNPNYNYECLDGNRYYRLVKQISYDNGISWVDTNEYQIGDIYEENSPWCTADEILIDWFEDRTECDGTDEYSIEIKRVSLDGGNTWTDMGYTENGVTTYETRRIIIDKNTCNCGAIGCDNYIQFRFSGTTCSFNVNNKSFTANTSNSVAQPDGTYIYTSNMRDLGIVEVTRRDNIFSSSNILNIYSIPYMLDYTKDTSLSYAFDSLSNVETIQFNNFNTSEVVNMNSMFYNCTNLKTLDLSSFDTSKVTDMAYMFANCKNLTNIDISNWNTPNLTSMDSMFYNCTNLKTLNLSSFDTSNVYTVVQIFRGCTNLSSIDVSGWNVSGITSYGNMFKGCTSLQELYIGDADDYTYNWWCARLSNANISCDIIKVSGDTGTTPTDGYFKVTYAAKTNNEDNGERTFKFNGVEFNTLSTGTLTVNDDNTYTYEVDIYSEKNISTPISQLTSLNGFFKLETDAIIHNMPDTTRVTDMRSLFSCWTSNTNLTFDPTQFNTSSLTTLGRNFYDYKINGEYLDLRSWDVSKVTSFASYSWESIFSFCFSDTIDIRGWNFASTNSLKYLFGDFYGSEILQDLDTSNITDMYGMFIGCYHLKSLDVSNFDTSNVTNMKYMFQNSNDLTYLDLSNFNTSNVNEMGGMFTNCRGLTILDVSSWNIDNVTSYSNMFQGCTSLTTLKVKNGTYDWWCARLTEDNISCDIIEVISNAGGGINNAE